MARFRTSARTVDMLGRQQIAGIPTAISELFKNAHDAYATCVEADYYRPDQLLVLRDDGLGMTPTDVMERWLVLGTDSKLDGGEEMAGIARVLGMQARVPTGEKGIGRLAIAAIGPQVLLVTRARRPDGLHPTVACFVNWSMFTLPGISLDQIEVPVREFPEDQLPTAEDVASLVREARKSLRRIQDCVPESEAAKIGRQLDQASLDVAALQERFESAALGVDATGTQFYIQPTDPMLEVALDAEPERRRIGDLQRTLMGFANTMMPGREDPPIATAFRDYKSPDLFDSVIGPEEFFTPEEFSEADHHIQGAFDEFGQFSGTVAVYGSKPEPHVVVWPGSRGKKTACGPFTIDFAYVQGVPGESRMTRERWHHLIRKLDRMGGLYIYRNGIRILPYGNTDYDFLDIEVRRNLGAGYYFFSYRRMFGAIDLPVDSSRRLIEKAGREGFRNNKAYHEFRTVLENFLIQLAADYFREEGEHGADYRRKKADLDRKAKALARQSQQSLERRRALEKRLEECSARLRSDEPQQTVDRVLERLARSVEAASHLRDSNAKLRTILEAESRARSQVAELRSTLRVPSPRGFAVTRALGRSLAAHRQEYAKVNLEVIKPTYYAIEEAVSGATKGLDASRRQRFDATAAQSQQAAVEAMRAKGRASREQLSATAEKVTQAVRTARVDLEAGLKEIGQRVQRTDVSELTEAEVVELSLQFESEISAIAATKEEQLEAIAAQLKAVAVDPDESGELITHLDTAGAVEEELLGLQERAEADLELTQLGMAIEIIDHEFRATIRSIRSNLRRLKAWADVKEELVDVYDGIRVNFEHLDSYLTLFTPLHRRLYRSEADIRGSEVARFLTDLFRDRLAREDVKMSATRAFLQHRFVGYRSTFYPVFVNLVDNACFWLRDQSSPRTITLDAQDGSMMVADSGPGIPVEDREAIFELGFTRKPGGRGLGLYISRDVLERVGYELIVDSSPTGEGVVFTVRPKEEEEDE